MIRSQMNCGVSRFGNCFLRVPLVCVSTLLPSALLPRQSCKKESQKFVYQTSLHSSFLSLSKIATSYHSIFHQVLDFILILRVTRIFKVFHAIPRFRTVLNTLVDILPSLLTYGSILFVVYYFFAIIGMELFQV